MIDSPKSSSKAFSMLNMIQWWAMEPHNLPQNIANWLDERGSMTQRFEQYCQTVTVEPQRQQFITQQALGDEQALLPASQRYWLREVRMFGDGVPWLEGRTVIPEQTLSGSDRGLLDLNTTPLGRYLFKDNRLTRDYIQIGRQGELWARRSLLRLSGNPLLLTEVFLPASPVYQIDLFPNRSSLCEVKAPGAQQPKCT
ncbi:chorismate lyase [Candidatus Regiella endosymbiont of Tuberolachnus salignus]|uniref:chorismate lyase n=1 Tax=Candidatus Regiella endosymbiont of Tuberolachnus salignus TaxID=3077956 RepID=UPI0030D01ABF